MAHLRSAQQGTFVGIAGPSGAGKDTLIELVRERFAASRAFAFPRRIVTRPPSPFEAHETVTEEEFTRRLRDGRFALHWRAHGCCYAIDAAIFALLDEGAVVTCNISRHAIAAAKQVFARVKIVLVTAPASALATRLAVRGREQAADIDERLLRNSQYSADLAPDMTILNAASPEVGAQALADYLLSLRRS